MAKKKRKWRFRFIVAEEYQPVQSVPVQVMAAIWVLVFASLALQVAVNLDRKAPEATAIALPDAPSEIALTSLAVGDKVAFSKALTLWLQAFDNQKGQSLSFRDLDYNKVADWMRAVLYLDPRTEYPLLNATHVYTALRGDNEKLRVMGDFVKEQFLLDPATRWQWLAGWATLAKNEINEPELALEYAQLLREHTEGLDVPSWVRQMEGFLLEDLNEYDASADFLLKLLESGEVTDPQEFIFLIKRLETLLGKMVEENRVTSKEQLQEMFAKFDKLQSLYLERSEQ